jgi:hypothetical protein
VADAVAVVGWLLAGICAGWAWRHRCEVDAARRQRMADAVLLHERDRQIAALQRDRDILVMQIGRGRVQAEQLVEAAAGAAMLAQWLAPSAPGRTDGLQPDSLVG